MPGQINKTSDTMVTKTFTADAIIKVEDEITLGSLVLIVDYNGIKPRHIKNTVKHSILGGTQSRRQTLGRDSTQYEIKGIFEGANKDADMETLRNYFLNNTVVAFQGHTDLSVQVTLISPFEEQDLITYWAWKIVVEETGD